MKSNAILFFWGSVGGPTPRSLWDLSSLTRDELRPSAVTAWSHNHWTAREFPQMHYSWKNYPGNRLEEGIDNNIHIYFLIRVVKEWYVMKICVFGWFCPEVWDHLMKLLTYTPSNNCHLIFPPLFVFSMKQVAVTIEKSRNCLEVLLKQLKREKMI